MSAGYRSFLARWLGGAAALFVDLIGLKCDVDASDSAVNLLAISDTALNAVSASDAAVTNLTIGDSTR